jgi:glucose-6-phosphate isomerase
MVTRFWAKDASLWPEENGQGQQGVAANLAWLDLPDQMGAYMAHVLALAKEAARDGFQDVVYIAMGDSNLAAEAISHTATTMRFRRLKYSGQHRSSGNPGDREEAGSRSHTVRSCQ